jgi:hypothetical protein
MEAVQIARSKNTVHYHHRCYQSIAIAPKRETDDEPPWNLDQRWWIFTPPMHLGLKDQLRSPPPPLSVPLSVSPHRIIFINPAAHM